MKLLNKVKSEKGQLADILIFFIFIVFVIYFIILFTSMQYFFITQKIVDNIVRDEVEVIRTKGMFTTAEYQKFLSKIGKYGSYNVHVVAEKQDAAGTRAKWFDMKDILDTPFKAGDFIKIFVESTKQPLFSMILNTNFMFGSGHSGGSSFRMQSMASGMVCSDGFIKGVEVINIINKNASNIPVRLKSLDYSNTNPNLEDSNAAQWDLYAPSSYTGATTEDIVKNPAKYDPNTYVVGGNIVKANGWIDYSGDYLMNVDVDTANYNITGMYFTETQK